LALAVSARLTRQEGRNFAFTVGLAFITLGTIAWWRGRETVSTAAWVVGGALLVAGLFVPTRLGPVQQAWMRLAHMMARVTTPIFMGIVYFVVLTPIAVLMRSFGRNPLTIHHSPNTVWVSRGQDRRSDLERQF
jgi:hypothetical protein